MYCTPGHDDGSVLISSECESVSIGIKEREKRRQIRQQRYHTANPSA
jgi:hypothetical protein